MNSYCKTVLMVVAVTLTLMLCIPAVAQGPADLTVADPAARPHPRRRPLTARAGESGAAVRQARQHGRRLARHDLDLRLVPGSTRNRRSARP